VRGLEAEAARLTQRPGDCGAQRLVIEGFEGAGMTASKGVAQRARQRRVARLRERGELFPADDQRLRALRQNASGPAAMRSKSARVYDPSDRKSNTV